ncbi:MAG: hypothetical protein AAF564_25980 [Bacteroidota bacterium]
MLNKSLWAIMALFVFLGTVTAAAQDQFMESMRGCASISDQTSRLACFDKAVERIPPRVIAGVPLAPGQNKSYACDLLVSEKVDRVSGERQVVSNEALVVSGDEGPNGLAIFSMKGAGELIIVGVGSVGASKCVAKGAKVNLLFRDQSRMELYNSREFSCESRHTLCFGSACGKREELKKLATSELEIMRVWTEDGYVEEEFTPEQSKTLMHTLACLNN